MKRKIGILTFHRAVNYGAALQAYALQRFMNEKGIDAEVIDYYNIKIENEYKAFKLKAHSLKEMVYNFVTIKERIVRKQKFSEFIDKYIKVSEQKYKRENIHNSCDIYDEFWVGSDQVWNLELSNDDLTYLLDFCLGKKRYSYAASIGKDKLSNQEIGMFTEILSSFQGITLREQSGVDLLMSIVNKEMQVVVDPTLLLTKEQWYEIVSQPQINEEYIVVYKITDSKVFDYAMQVSKQEHCKVIVLQAPHRHMPSSFYAERYVSPEEWLGWIANAKYVVTDSFHATVFSIIFEKNFMSLEGYNSGGHKNHRINSILEICNLTSRFTTEVNVDSLINVDIDYKEVKYRLETYIQTSEDFIIQRQN